MIASAPVKTLFIILITSFPVFLLDRTWPSRAFLFYSVSLLNTGRLVLKYNNDAKLKNHATR